MSRRTFPRAVAAGLVAAAFVGPAAGQTPNPWRGESAAPTAPAPRAVATKPTRQLSIGLGFSSAGGLTMNVEVRELPRAMPALKAPERVSLPLPSPRYLEHFPQYFPPDPSYPMPIELQRRMDPEAPVVRASYSRVPEYMPPPPPLPVQPIPPAAP